MDIVPEPRGVKRGRTPAGEDRARSRVRTVTPEDRFVPRKSEDAARSFKEHTLECDGVEESGGERSAYVSALQRTLLSPSGSRRFMKFGGARAVTPRSEVAEEEASGEASGHRERDPARSVSSNFRKRPVDILDAPDLYDDYYVNVLSWSSRNVIGVALGESVYTMDAASKRVHELDQLDDPVTAVSWAPAGAHVAVGDMTANLYVYDVETGGIVRDLGGHTARIGSLAWNPMTRCLTSGNRVGDIIEYDLRSPARSNGVVATRVLDAHTQEVCGLKWSHDGLTLASGGNENALCLWDARRSGASCRAPSRGVSVDAPRAVVRRHAAAVKAIAWSHTRRHLLASGGGTADRTVRLWNTANETPAQRTSDAVA